MQPPAPPAAGSVNPARAGMILCAAVMVVISVRKPRASGDDPPVHTINETYIE